MTNAEKKLSKILEEQINREINNEILNRINHKNRQNNCYGCYDEYGNQELERRPYKQSKKKGIKIHKTPEVSNTPKYIYAKYAVPLTDIKTVGNPAPVNLNVKTKYWKTVEGSFYTTSSKITDEKDVIGL